MDELFTLLLLNVGNSPTVVYKEKLDILIAEHVLDVIWIDDVIAKEAWDAFERFNVDKLWSFTDCTSYVVMKRLNISEVFAFDHHFEQIKGKAKKLKIPEETLINEWLSEKAGM